MLSTMFYLCGSRAPQIRVFSTRVSIGDAACHARSILGRNVAARRPVGFVPARNLMKAPKPSVSFKPYHAKDQVPQTYQVIYFNGSINYIKYGVPLIYLGFVIVMAQFGWILKKKYIDKDTLFSKKSFQKGRFLIKDPIHFVWLGIPFFTFVIIGALMMSKNIMVRIYKDMSTGQYMGRSIHYGLFSKTLEFTPADVKRHVYTNMMFGGNVRIKGQRFVLLEHHFRSIGDYNKLFGYDFDRESDFERQQASEDVDVTLVLKKSVEAIQNAQYRSFEQKYREKRKLRNLK